jgi:hypothetical protein
MDRLKRFSRRRFLSAIASTTAGSCLSLVAAATLATESTETCAAQSIRVRASGEAAAPPTVAKVDDAVVEFTATPDFRQISNNQWSSWIVFSARLPASFAGRTIQFGLSTYLPEGVAMTTKLSVVKKWWKPRRRPLPNYWV